MKKKKKIGRKLLSFLLTLAMVVGLLPGMGLTAYAATDTYTTLMNNVTVVKFNGYNWYIIEDNSNSATAGTVTLLAADNAFGLSAFSDSNSNAYSSSKIKVALDAMTAEGGAFAGVADVIETVKVKGSDSDTEVDAKLYLLSTSEAQSLNQTILGYDYPNAASGAWWLRSPSNNYGENAVCVYGGVAGDGPVSYELGVRPALKLDLSKVTFDSNTKTFVKYVASVTSGTTTQYTDFADAVTAWNTAGNGATLKLLADVEINSGITVNRGYGNPMILDLNGYGIRYTGDGNSVIVVTDEGNLELTDSAPNRVHYITLDANGRGTSVAESGTESDSCVKVTGGYLTGGVGYNNGGNRRGGGLFVNGAFTMDGGTIVGNTVCDSSGHGLGGGVYIGGTVTFNMNGGTITANTAKNSESGYGYGGGVYVNGGTFNMKGGTISGNKSESSGGGTYVDHGVLNLTDGTISGNTAMYGGGVNVSSGGKFNMNGGTINENTATSKGGGVSSLGDVEMTGGKIKGNKAVNYAGVRVDGGTFTMKDGEISGNTASEYIGGVYIYISSVFTMTGGKIVDNKAAISHGGVYVIGTFNLSGNPTISGNKSGTDSDAVDSNVSLEMNKTIIVTDALTNNDPVGVTMRTPGVFTSGGIAKAYKVNFTSDDPAYGVTIDADELTLVEACTVTFDANGGTGMMNPQSVNQDMETELNANTFTREEYSFDSWNTKADGTGTKYADKAVVKLSEDTILYAIWKQIPAATITEAPKGKSLTYNGQAQELVMAGKAEGGTMWYALGADATTAPEYDGTSDNLNKKWSTSIPTATDAGTYYVWYKVIGDEDHLDTEAESIEVKIDKAKGDTDTDDIFYVNVEGAGGEWTKGSSDSLQMTFKRSVVDSETFDHFKGILVDGKAVNASDYTAESGSVIIKLNPSFLETLTVGEHVLTAQFDDADDAEADFTVKEAETSEDTEDTGKDDEISEEAAEPAKDADIKPADTQADTQKTADEKIDSPKTGDETNPQLMLLVMLLAAIDMALVAFIKSKKKKNR